MGPYSIGLLNDLHEHFPDLLYRTQRFTTVSSVLDYVVEVARQDTFHQARETAQVHARQARVQSIFQDFLTTLLPQLHEPSASAIEQATLLIHAIQPSECAICQDSIQIGDPVRMIRFCTHAFHQSCLDPWLRGHTTCPTCRHDLLEDH